MTRILITLAATAALAGPAFAQLDQTALTTSCADYLALDADARMELATLFEAQAEERRAADNTTVGPLEPAQRMENLNVQCTNSPNGTVYQAAESATD